MKEIVKYVAHDGVEFCSAEACRKHEAERDNSWVLAFDSNGNQVDIDISKWNFDWICLKGPAAWGKLCECCADEDDGVPEEFGCIEDDCKYRPNEIRCYQWNEDAERFVPIGGYYDLANIVATLSHYL